VRALDLTHTFDNGMPVFPGLPDPSFEPIAKVEDDGYAMTRYSMLNHIGTHVDAPAHQIAGGDTLDEIGLERLVLFYSDNARNYGTDAYWTGWSFPDADASRALIERGVSAVGFDGPSADPVDSTTFDLHRVWLGAGRMILENVNNLDRLPARAQLVVAPMKVARANGAPTRIYALLPD